MSQFPVLPAIVQHHADDAAFYFARRLDACSGAEHDLRSLLRMEQLLQANLEGLRVAQWESAPAGEPVGTAGWEPVLRRLNRWRSRDEAFVAGVLALQASNHGNGTLWQTLQQQTQAQHAAAQGDEIAHGLAEAVGWLWADAAFAAAHEHLQHAVHARQRSAVPLWQRAALRAHLAAGHEPPAAAIEAALASSDADLAQTAAECASRWSLSAHAGALLAVSEAQDAPPSARCAAAAALCLTVGTQEPELRTQALRVLGQAWREQPGSLALEPLMVWALTSLEAPADIETALGQRSHWRAALQAMRFSADPRWLPVLLSCVQHQCQPEELRQFFAQPRSNLARLAGDVFAHLSGACISHQLWQPLPEPQSDEDVAAEATLLDPTSPARGRTGAARADAGAGATHPGVVTLMATPDPWADAQAIAQRLRQADTGLLVVIGAAAWCQKCRRLHPGFEQLALALPEHVLPLWLDLEDHAEFLGSFVPPDLPLLLRWREGTCVQAAVVQDIQSTVADPGQRVTLQPLALDGDHPQDPSDGALLALPALWQEFAGGR